MFHKLILTDVDESILQWSAGFTKFLYNRHNFENIRPRDDHRVYKWLEIHPQEAMDLILEFNLSDEFGLLEPFDGAETILPKLYDDGYKFVAITSCSSDGIIEKMRRENLMYYFGNIFEKIYCLDFDADKGQILNQYPKSFWVEDSSDWAERGADIGHLTFLINHEHNKRLNDPRIIRVDDWHTIYNTIRSFDENSKEYQMSI